MNCPRCGGELVKTHKKMSWDYNCRRCRRGWRKDENGCWHVLFAADLKQSYTPKEWQDAQLYWCAKR